MNDRLEIHRVAPADHPSIAAVFATNLEFLALQGDVPPGTSELPDGLVDSFVGDESEAGGSVWVVRDEAGATVAVAATLVHPRERVPWIGLLVVHAACQGQGSGRRIERLLTRQFRDQGYGVARLGVLTTNPRALRFWTRIGYREIDRRLSTDGLPTIVCERVLDHD